jgi:hypothetical protein
MTFPSIVQSFSALLMQLMHVRRDVEVDEEER